MRIVLVGCGKQKQASGTWPARDLYTSTLFKKARAWAEAVGDRWFIVSGKYGLLAPDSPVAVYDSRILRPDQEWASRVAWSLLTWGVPWHIGDPPHEVVILAGAAYAKPLTTSLRQGGRPCAAALPCRVTLPLRGMGIGDRLHYLSCIPDRPHGPAGTCDWCGRSFPELSAGEDHEGVPRRWCLDCAIDPCCPCPDDCGACDYAHCRETEAPAVEIRARLRPAQED